MVYFEILNLKKEPFSNSPDPEFFFQSRQHLGCLQQLEISVYLRRGLNVVVGDVGTGKTTLCRQLIKKFTANDEFEAHLILDPHFNTASEFLSTVAEIFEGCKPATCVENGRIKESIKQHLFRKGVDEDKTVILIIDEGQKIPLFCLEILREFLNYETNEYKLMQIIIFAQKEFEKTVRENANFADRINLYYHLKPLNFRETRRLIQFRIDQSSESAKTLALFSYPSLWAIYLASRGYPRKIINLCHRILLTMIIQNRPRAGWFMVRSCVQRTFSQRSKIWRWVTAAAALPSLLAIALMAGPAFERLKIPMPQKPEGLITTILQDSEPEIRTSADIGHKDLIKTGAEDSRRLSRHGDKLPVVLGRVAVRPNETLWNIIENVYGISNTQYLNSVIRANPYLTDPNHIEVGQLISLPAIPVTFTPLPTKVWWVKAGEKGSLEEAIRFLRSYPPDAPSIRILPYWNRQDGLKFAVVLKEYFFDEISAGNQLNKLPPSVVAGVTILSLGDQDAVFFADPFSCSQGEH